MTFPGLVRANNLNDVVDRERAWDNLGANISANIPIPSPSLDLNFAANKSLVDNISGNNLITFSRASTGTFVGSDGLIQTAASGVPRFDHNGATGESLGLMVEEARTNLQFPSVSTIARGTPTITANAAVDPNGTTTATLLVPNGVDGHGLGTDASINKTFGQVYSHSFYYKPNGYNVVGIDYGSGGPDTYAECWINVTNPSSFLVSYAFTQITSQQVSNGWYRIVATQTAVSNGTTPSWGKTLSCRPTVPTAISQSFTPTAGSGGYFWGHQEEVGTFPTSYIPTSGATVTRAADVMQIIGTNLSSFYNAGRGTIYAEQFKQAGTGGVAIGDTASNRLLNWPSSRIYSTSWGGVDYTWTGAPAVSATSLNRAALAYGQTVQGSVNGSSYVLSPFIATASFPTTSLAFQGAFSRIIFWGNQLPSSAIAAITSISNVQIGALPSSYATNATILGKDIAALNAVRNTSTRDFVFIKGLLSAAQPRLTTAAVLASSGTASQNASLLKASPTSSGNFFIERGGIVASGLRVNNTNIASLSSSAFSGSTALFPIVVSSLKLSSGLQWAPAMTSGTVTSPGKAIPIETSEFILFAKAGQS